jgi:hypothetical protein
MAKKKADSVYVAPQFEIHPYAKLFPLHEGQPLWDLSDDIKEHGQREPIWLLDGMILDGRRRWLACVRAEVTVQTRNYEGNDPLGFVISTNLHRRHLDESERSLVAAKLKTMKIGDNQHSEGVPIGTPSITLENAGEMLNVSRRSVMRASKVLEKGAQELVEAVEKGDVSVSDAAAVADKPPEVQRAAVVGVQTGVAPTLQSAVAVIEGVADDVLNDVSGFPIPERAVEHYGAVDEIAAMCRQLDQVVKRIRDVAMTPGGRYMHSPTQVQTIQSVRKSLWGSRPTHVCPYCRGERDCSACGNLGLVNVSIFNQAPPEKRAATGESNASS